MKHINTARGIFDKISKCNSSSLSGNKNRKTPLKNNKIILACWLIVLLLFGILPSTFVNYGWNYWQFLPILTSASILAVVALVLLAPTEKLTLPRWAQATLLFAVPLAAAAIFWAFRTQIHCFGGDGAVGIVPQGAISPQDFIPPLPPNRLDGYLVGVIGKLCRASGLFSNSEIMPSILATQIHTIVVGTIFIALACIFMRRKPALLAALLTLPFIFNFFGNIDSYAFSLLIALVFMMVARKVDAAEHVGFLNMALLCLVWGIGLWTHPFHVFSGFIVAVEGTRFLKKHRPFAKLPDWALPTLYGIVLFTVVKSSQWSNSFFTAAQGETPPSFSADTFTHYLNMLLLPIAPLIAASVIDKGQVGRIKTKTCIFIMQSVVFFIMAFTLGAVDQFNYQHLLMFFVAPWIILGGDALPTRSLRLLVAANLFLLLPMIAVHTTARTIARAQAVYPVDPCKHNTIMSWQTHLGLVLGDNLQSEPAVKKACLRVFENGSRHANPPGFRGGNYVYHTAFLYHFGEFEKGRAQLFGLLRNNPGLLKNFLGVRPGFIYCNRKRLWDDLELFLRQSHHPQINDFIKLKETLIQKALSEPYYIHRPSYAETDV